MYFVKSKFGPSESCDTSYSDHLEMDNRGGEGNGHNTNMMGCVEQTIYCAFEEYGLVFFYGSPLGIWSLETMELFLFLFFACGQASFFYSIALYLLP